MEKPDFFMYKVKEYLSVECRKKDVRIRELVKIKCEPEKLDLDDPLNELSVQRGEVKLRDEPFKPIEKVEKKTKKNNKTFQKINPLSQ